MTASSIRLPNNELVDEDVVFSDSFNTCEVTLFSPLIIPQVRVVWFWFSVFKLSGLQLSGLHPRLEFIIALIVTPLTAAPNNIELIGGRLESLLRSSRKRFCEAGTPASHG